MSQMIISLNKFNIFNELKNNEILKNVKLFYVFEGFTKTKNAIIVTNDDKVYAFGYNSYGVLGFGHSNHVNELTIVEELCHKGMIELKNSYFHTMALTFDGKLYCWGSNIFGVLGNEKQHSQPHKPKLNQFFINKQITQMSCGWKYALVLTIGGQVYALGRNDSVQIHNTNQLELTPHFMIEFNDQKVISISSGQWHSLALTQSGRVYSWGSKCSERLGRNIKGKDSKCPKPIELEEGITIEKIICGHSHSLLLSREGDLYFFGNKYYSESGRIYDWNEFLPIKLNICDKFEQIASHYICGFSSARTINGLYYIWGNIGIEYTNRDVIKEPKGTHFKSFNDIFNHYLGITYCEPIDMKLVYEFIYNFIRNGFYDKEYNRNIRK